MTQADPMVELLTRVRAKRAQVSTFLAAAKPRRRRLLNTVVLGGSLAAVLTAGPAIGGATFTAWLTATLGLSSPSWRLLCGVASVCSLMATISTQLLKSHNIEENVVKAQACSAKLEVIETGLALGQLDVKQATDHYLRCVEDAAFLDA